MADTTDSAVSRSDPKACLFVASLSSNKSEDHLHESVTRFFARFGPIKHVKVIKDWMGRPYAFVQFENAEDGHRALVEGNGGFIDGRRIRIEQAKVNRTLFLARFPKSSSQEACKNFYIFLKVKEIEGILEQYGPVEEFVLLEDALTQSSKGCGFVKFKFREDALRAFSSLREQTPWVVEWASNMERGEATTELDLYSIFVGNLDSENVTQELIEEKFGQYGKIESIQYINTTRSSFAFITYSDEKSANDAIHGENGSVWFGRPIRVQHRETIESRARTRTASATVRSQVSPKVQPLMAPDTPPQTPKQPMLIPFPVPCFMPQPPSPGSPSMPMPGHYRTFSADMAYFYPGPEWPGNMPVYPPPPGAIPAFAQPASMPLAMPHTAGMYFPGDHWANATMMGSGYPFFPIPTVTEEVATGEVTFDTVEEEVLEGVQRLSV